jgi:PEP-CTERM motif
MLAASVLPAWADNDGEAGIKRGNADGDGGEVTVTVESEGGAKKVFRVPVAPGANSADVMKALAEKINADPDLTAGTSEFTVGEPQNGEPPSPDRFKVDNLKIRSLNGGFQIKSIRIDPDGSGLNEYGSKVGALPNWNTFELYALGPAEPGNIDFRAILGGPSGIDVDLLFSFANGSPVDEVLSRFADGLAGRGIQSVMGDNSLALLTHPGQYLFVGLSSQDVGPVAYSHSLEAAAVPEPTSAFLLLVGAGLCAVRLCGRRTQKGCDIGIRQSPIHPSRRG